jgi:glycerol-3-phosphate dehydrogenase
VWCDYVTLEPDRLTFAWALAAHEHGAILANHVAAMSIARDTGRVAGIHAVDTLTGNALDISARVVVNATGAMADRLLESIGAASGVPVVRAMNLVTRRDAGDEALGGRSASGRNLFMVPWRDRAIFGTWESARVCGPDDRSIDNGEVAAFISELNGAFPALDLTPADITLVHRGVVPAVVDGDRVTLEGHDRIHDHRADGADGLITVLGPKYTTARAVAERATDMVWRKLRRAEVPCRTASTVLPGGSIRDVGLAIADARREHDEGLPTDAIPHLIAAYGSRFRDVIDVASGRADLRTRIARDSPVIGAELVVAVRHEMALTLPDAVIRRTPLGALGYPGDDAVARAAEVVGAELKWSEARKRTEAASVRAFYELPDSATAP